MKENPQDIGDDLSEERLLPLVYDELRRMAAIRMKKEPSGQTLQPTALVHEAWLRLRKSGGEGWDNKAHFFGAAGQAMRRILVDNARRKAAYKRKTNERPEELKEDDLVEPGQEDHVLMIHESLLHLEKEDPEAAKIVLLKFFSGLDSREIAKISGGSVRSVERQWTLAKARLYQIIRGIGYKQEEGEE